VKLVSRMVPTLTPRISIAAGFWFSLMLFYAESDRLGVPRLRGANRLKAGLQT
jgi:hypothetical protein